MIANADDWQKFFEEFGSLLNKYNFMISEFVLGKAFDNRIKLVSFRSDGKKVYPVYDVPDDMAHLLGVEKNE